MLIDTAKISFRQNYFYDSDIKMEIRGRENECIILLIFKDTSNYKSAFNAFTACRFPSVLLTGSWGALLIHFKTFHVHMHRQAG